MKNNSFVENYVDNFVESNIKLILKKKNEYYHLSDKRDKIFKRKLSKLNYRFSADNTNSSVRGKSRNKFHEKTFRKKFPISMRCTIRDIFAHRLATSERSHFIYLNPSIKMI